MAAIRLDLGLWEVMLVTFSDVGPNEVVQRVQVRGGGGSERRLQSRSTSSEANPGSLWTCGRHRVLLPHPGSATGHLIAPGDHHTLYHIQVHFGVDFQADFEDVRWHDVALTWNHTKDHNRSWKLCFHNPGHVAQSGFAYWRCWQWSCCHNLDR